MRHDLLTGIIIILKVRKEKETLENQKAAALEAIRRLGYVLVIYQHRHTISEKELLLKSIKGLKERFFPDKTWKEIFSKPNEPTRGSKTAF